MPAMVGATAFVGVEPEGLRLLAASLDAAEVELDYATANLAALLDEADQSEGVVETLRATADEWIVASADIRRRAVVAEEFAAVAAAPRCVVPWWDPLRRAAVAVHSNVWRFGSGAVDSLSGSASMIWRLTPVNGEWRQEWVDLRVGLAAAKENPVDTLESAAGLDVFSEEGWSYWLGGVIPDLAMSAFGGAGVANRTARTADLAGDMADAAEGAGRLERLAAAAAVATKRGIVEGDNPLHLRPPVDPSIEPVAKARVLDSDAATNGHSGSRHGPDTTLEQQRIRAETRRTPDGKVDKKRRDASRFFRWQDQAEAIEEAERRWRDGDDTRKQTIRFGHAVGEGFLAGGKHYRQTHVVVVRLDDQGRAFTAFPDIKAGR